MSIIISTTVRQFPKLPYETMKNDILGKSYQLSLTFVGAARARKLNWSHRQKTYTPNVLSFALDPTVGEIYICPKVARTEAPKFSLSPSAHLGYLFIHGLLHLKGYTHGDTMELAEKKYISKYKLQ